MTEFARFLLLSVALLTGGDLLGEEPSAKDFRQLPDYIAYGLANNPGLQAYYDSYEAALEVIPQAKSLPDPKMTANFFVEDVQTRTGPQRSQISLGQTFPWFGKLRLRGEVASKEADALHHAYQAKLLDVVEDITVAYYDYAYLREATRITDEIVNLLERLEEPVQEKVRGGGDQAPLLRLQVEIGKVQDELQTFEKQKPTQSAGLNSLLGRRDTESLPFPALDKPDASIFSSTRLASELLADNPELKSLQSRIEKAAEAIKLSKLSPIPDPTIGAGVFDTGQAINRSTPGSGNNPWSVQIGFTIPLWFGKYKAENREAAQRYAEATKSLTDRENLLLADLENVLQTLAEVDRRLDLYGNTLLPRARQAYEVTESSYRADRSSILDLIDSQRSLLEIERTYWRAAAHHYQAIIRLQTLTGARSQ